MAGEVLGHGDHPCLLQASQEGGPQLADQPWVAAQVPVGERRVGPLHHVDHRGQVDVHSQVEHLLAQQLAGELQFQRRHGHGLGGGGQRGDQVPQAGHRS